MLPFFLLLLAATSSRNNGVVMSLRMDGCRDRERYATASQGGQIKHDNDYVFFH